MKLIIWNILSKESKYITQLSILLVEFQDEHFQLSVYTYMYGKSVLLRKIVIGTLILMNCTFMSQVYTRL